MAEQLNFENNVILFRNPSESKKNDVLRVTYIVFFKTKIAFFGCLFFTWCTWCKWCTWCRWCRNKTRSINEQFGGLLTRWPHGVWRKLKSNFVSQISINRLAKVCFWFCFLWKNRKCLYCELSIPSQCVHHMHHVHHVRHVHQFWIFSWSLVLKKTILLNY